MSLFLSDFMTKYNPALSFYFTHTRIWEYLLERYLPMPKFQIYENKSKFMNEIMPFLGINLICFSIFFLEKMSTPIILYFNNCRWDLFDNLVF